MTIDFNPISFVIICLLIYIGYLTKYYLPNYFKKKAENLAQIEDIEKLTSLVKEVEYKFEERTQYLKSKLDLSNQLQLGLENEERITLINLHNRINEYYNFLTDVTFNGIDLSDNKCLQNHQNERAIKSDAIFILKNNAMLFIDEESIDKIEDPILALMSLFNKFSSKYLAHMHQLEKKNLINRQNLSSEEIDEYYNQIGTLNSNYTKEVTAMIENIGPKISGITIIIRKHLAEKVKKPST